MKLTPEQLITWWQIVVRSVYKNPSYTVDTKRELSKREMDGLRQGINDLISAGVGSFQLDEELRAAGLPDTDEMERMLRRKEKGIIRRGVIRNDEEYYIAKEALDSGLNDLSDKAVSALAKMMDAYAKQSQANQPAQPNAGSRPSSGDSPASETPSAPAPRG